MTSKFDRRYHKKKYIKNYIAELKIYSKSSDFTNDERYLINDSWISLEVIMDNFEHNNEYIKDKELKHA